MTVKPLPAIAPRGKVFSIAHMNCVAVPSGLAVLLQGRLATFAEAALACSKVDDRLSPSVTMIDSIKE